MNKENKQPSRHWRAVSALVVVTALALVVTACSVKDNYGTLSCFFDGVPDPNAKVVVKVVKPGDTPTTPKVVTSTLVVHPPFRERKCKGCHSAMFSKALVTTKDKLCDRCHEGLKDAPAVHGPVAAGACLACHDPHSSKNAVLLVAPAEELCMRCHDDTFRTEANYHADRGDKTCITCHSGHVTTIKIPDDEQGHAEPPESD